MLRILLLLVVVIGIVLWWKHQQRGRHGAAPPTPPPPAAEPEAMLRCAECGLHLPASQTLPGRGGAFCSVEHRTRFEARG